MSLESRQLDSEIAQRKQLLDKIEAEATTVTRVSAFTMYHCMEMTLL